MPIMLKEALARLTVPQLKELLDHVPDAKAATRKDDLVERIASALLGPELMAAWLGLDEVQRAAVAEAAHDPLGEYSAQRFQAKYQKQPVFQVAKARSHGYSSGKKSALCLFIHSAGSAEGYCVPADLGQRLREFVPPPAPLQLASFETLPVQDGWVERLTEREALQEVGIMLRTIEQARIQVSEKTAQPGAAALRVLSEKLVGGDFYPVAEKRDPWDQEIGPIKAFAWPMLLQAGGLVARTGSRLALGPAGVKALGAPAQEVLRGLWRKWVKSTLLDEFSRMDEIKGQNSKGRVMGAVAPRRAVVEEALRECPVGRWVTLDDFSRFMQASDLGFVVAHDPWQLYLCERRYGSLGYDGSHGWNILQERYILVLLFEYAATLGMVDLCYQDPKDCRNDFRGMWGADELGFLSRYDGLVGLRLSALGAYVLGMTTAYAPVVRPSDVALSVLPSLQVSVLRGSLSTEEGLLLNQWAEPVQPGSWRLDRQKALLALETGHGIAELRRFLESHDDVPLPEPVESFLLQCEHDGRALKLGASAVLIECRDPQTAERVASHPETRALCLRAGPSTLVVRTDQLDKFHQRVRLLGLGMRP
ncbi:MAG: hypothetical protein A3F78_03460 [Burkholderiales bacterium RIFCSPLOWO2_12_FULL_61_40]|nr:MAG: hypothetical protein A3F78_03460 [Burkholderiales bacterium RIFCSPLOWO2_12_FULL_61_40]